MAAMRSDRAKSIAELAIAVGLIGLLGATVAQAGTDTTFTTSVTNLTSWTQGSLGKLAAVASLGVGVVGAILRFDWKLIAGAVGIGLAASTGPAIVSGLMSATF
jgi:conjugal transfer pilus assembly protein TraA